MNVAIFLHELCDDLAGCGTTSRKLSVLEFAADGRDINVRSCKERRGSYPDLWTIVGGVGRTLQAQGVAVGQLRRMTFLDAEISLELVDGNGQPRACSWPLTSAGLGAWPVRPS